MRIGYACQTIGVPHTGQKSCMLKNARSEVLTEITAHNLNALENIIHYNIQNDIRLFRISSELIPFGSSPVNQTRWWELFAPKLVSIGEKIKAADMRVSTHPGQYSVLNSPNEEIVKRAAADLAYHVRILDSLGTDTESKVILHIGGIYGDKMQAVERFCENYKRLDEKIRRRLVIENDDRSYSIDDVLSIGEKLHIPVVFDNLHHAINPSEEERTDAEWVEACSKTWGAEDGPQKIHYSQQSFVKKPGAHSETIQVAKFLNFCGKLKSKDLDIMLEVKDKNLSAVKCINCILAESAIKALKPEWSRYKFMVLENAPENYKAIRELLKNKNGVSPVDFYELIESAMRKERSVENCVNAALHIWNSFKGIASDSEKNIFMRRLKEYQNGKVSLKAVKSYLWRLSIKYKQQHLLDSYYFFL